MKKKTLKLSVETLRRLDLEAVNGGVVNPSFGTTCDLGTTMKSCGIVMCTLGPQKPRPRTLASCGIVCF